MMHEHDSCECGVCKVPSFERNHYFHGKTLSARDLTAEQRYFNEKRWLINRFAIGWGVVCGLDVSLDDDCLTVTQGLALDCCGREILVCANETLPADAIAKELGVDPEGRACDTRWALCLDYRECGVEAVKRPSSCDQQDRGYDYNRIRDSYQLCVRPFDKACPDDHSVSCCPPGERLGRETPIHRSVVSKSRECAVCKDCACVLLATGTLKVEPHCPPRLALDADAWKYRRMVYTNPLLAGLVQCFHSGLAHITGINWTVDAHYKVDEFVRLLRQENLRVTFDKAMHKHAVENPRSCRLSVYLPGEGDSCPVQVLIPVTRIEYHDCAATYYFDYRCAEHELRRSCQKRQRPAEVELLLHGSLMLDENDRALDAELIRDFPTGNGVEAGEFIACFTVEP
jgi:hypothetical protein